MVDGLEGDADEVVDVGVGVGVGQVAGGGGAVGFGGFLLAAELAVEVGAHEMEDGIRRIFFNERGGDFQGLLVFLVEIVEIDGEVEAGFGWGDGAFVDSVVELADAVLLAATGDAHEEAEHFRHGREGVGVVVVQAEAEVGVGESGVEGFGADEALAGTDAVAGGVARFAAQAVEAGIEGVAHAGVEVHVRAGGGITAGGDVSFGDGDDFCRDVEVVLVGGKFCAVAGVAHAVFVFGGGAPDLPPESFVFEEVAEGVIGAVLLHLAGGD